jgi:hypothetical protein
VQSVRCEPSQAPPQEEPSLAQAARVPRGGPTTAAQLPFTTPLQASHWPSQALSQQYPSTQLPEAHWLVRVQAAPWPSAATQVLAPVHQLPVAQSGSAVQAVVQEVAPHR